MLLLAMISFWLSGVCGGLAVQALLHHSKTVGPAFVVLAVLLFGAGFVVLAAEIINTIKEHGSKQD